MHGTANPVFGSSILPSASIFRARFFLILAMLMVCMISIAKPVYAVDLYYVELGRFETQTKATDRWQELLDAQTALLDELTAYPREVIHEGRRREVHLYAGPLEGKQEANRLCKRLFEADIACFVVEGLPVISARLSQAKESADLPWLAEKAEQKKQQQILPWVVAKPASADNETAASSPSATTKPAVAKVEVAEAVRVPLSDAGDLNRRQSEQTEKSFVTIFPFANERQAIDFWRSLADQSALARKANVSRNLASRAYQLRVSLAGNEAASQTFCREIVAVLDASLQCAAVSELRMTPEVVRSDPAPVTAEPAMQFWIEIRLEKASPTASDAWIALQREHSDLLSQLALGGSSVDNRENQILKIGRFNEKNDAVELCYQLKQRGLFCQVAGGI